MENPRAARIHLIGFLFFLVGVFTGGVVWALVSGPDIRAMLNSSYAVGLCMAGGWVVEGDVKPIKETDAAFGPFVLRVGMIMTYALPAALVREYRQPFGTPGYPWSPTWSLAMGTALYLFLMIRAIVLYRRREATLRRRSDATGA